LSSRVGARIESVTAREILDSRGRPTVEADVRLADGILGRASVPSGASTGRYEALELRDHDLDRFGGFGVRGAVRNVREVIAPAVAGRDARDQAGLDTMLLELDGTPGKERLGANALLAVSIATARAAAAASGLALWRYLAGAEPALPLPMVNIFSGGLHAPRGLAFQDFLIVPVAARRYSEALETVYAVRSAAEGVLAERGLSTLKADEGGFGPAIERPEHAFDLLEEATRRAGYRAGAEVAFAVDVAASDGRYYELPHEGRLGALELVELLERLVARYPIVSIEDGLGEDDWEGWTLLTGRLGKRVQLLGDDLFTTDRLRLERGIEAGVANAVLVKMNQIGTLTETISVIEQARHAGYATVVSARSGETEDPFIADLAVATGAGQIKIGSLAQSERLAKYNQLLRIEDELGPEAVFAGASALVYAHAGLRPRERLIARGGGVGGPASA
jgi:enolase